MEDKLFTEQKSQYLKKPGIKHSSMVFSITFLIFILGELLFPFKNYYASGIVLELTTVALPPVIIFLLFKFNLKESLRWNKTSLKNILLSIGISISAIPLVSIVNIIYVSLLKQIFGRIFENNVPEMTNASQLVLGLIVIAMSAAFCEELLFRGAIQTGMEEFGPVASILITGFLFGLMHSDFQKFLGTFILGCIIGFIAYRTNSIFTAMTAHFTNNALAVLLSYLSTKLHNFLSKNPNTVTNAASVQDNQAYSLFFIVLIFGTSLYVFLRLINVLLKTNPPPVLDRERFKKGYSELLWLLPGIAVIIIIYYIQGKTLILGSSVWIKDIVKSFF